MTHMPLQDLICLFVRLLLLRLILTCLAGHEQQLGVGSARRYDGDRMRQCLLRVLQALKRLCRPPPPTASRNALPRRHPVLAGIRWPARSPNRSAA